MNYSFKIYALNIIDEYVSPVNAEALDIVTFYTEGQKFIRNKLSANIVLEGEDYSLVYPLLVANPCVEFEFNIYKNCDNGLVYSGVFTYYNIGVIDNDYCKFDFSLTTNDNYRKFLNTWKDKVNILNANTVSGGAIYPVLFNNNPDEEFFTVILNRTEDTHVVNGLQDNRPPLNYGFGNQWVDYQLPGTSILIPCVIYRTDYDLLNIIATEEIPVLGQPITYNIHWNYNVTVNMKAETKDVAIIGGVVPYQDPSIWVYFATYINGITGVEYNRYAKRWVLPYTQVVGPLVYGEVVSDTLVTIPYSYVDYDLKIYNTSNLELPNCRLLSDVIKYMLSETGNGATYLSDFFLAFTNPISGEDNFQLKYLMFSQKSDCIYPIDTGGLATKGMWTLEDLLTRLRDKIQVYWDLVPYVNQFGGNSYYLRLEHEDFYENGLTYNSQNILNITASSEYLEETNKFSILFDKFFGRETFKDMEAFNDEFIGYPIIYNNCLTDKNSNKEYNISDISTDLIYVYSGNNIGGGTAANNISDSGFVLLHTQFDNIEQKYRVVEYPGVLLSTTTVVNGYLGWANLHNKFWKLGRILPSGKMNGVLTNFISPQKLKLQEEISIPFCLCENNGLDFYQLIQINSNPIGKMYEARYNLNNEMLNIKLVYNV
jgi:hypothetical protein